MERWYYKIPEIANTVLNNEIKDFIKLLVVATVLLLFAVVFIIYCGTLTTLCVCAHTHIYIHNLNTLETTIKTSVLTMRYTNSTGWHT